MSNYKELKKICTTYTDVYGEIDALIDHWANGKKKLKAVMHEIYSLYGQNTILTDNHLATAYLYALSEFFQDPTAIGEMITMYESEFPLQILGTLSYWEEHPGFWCHFSVKKKLADDLFAIIDHKTNKEHILYSPAITTVRGKDNPQTLHFLSLMLPSGECLQTLGAVKHYRFPVSDFTFYCSLFKPATGLKSILSKHYPTFVMLDAIASLPITSYKEYPLGFAWQPFTLPEFDILQLGGDWVIDTLETFQKFDLNLLDPSMDKLPNRKLFKTAAPAMEGSLVRNNTTGEMAICTNTERAYTFFSALLKKAYPELKFPREPVIFISLALQSLLATMDLPLPWKRFTRILAYQQKAEIVRSAHQKLESMQGQDNDGPMSKITMRLLGMFVDAAETGEPIDIERACQVTSLDRELVKVMVQGFENMDKSLFDELLEEFLEAEMHEEATFEVPDEDKPYELTGWPMPADDRFFLSHDLDYSAFFDVDTSKEVEKEFIKLSNKKFAKAIRKHGLVDLIGDLFVEAFGDGLGYPVLNTFFWILYHKGREWNPVRSYAIEVLKWTPGFIFDFFDEPEAFITTFSLFCQNILCPIGLCSLSSDPRSDEVDRGAYTIKATEAFTSLLTVKG